MVYHKQKTNQAITISLIIGWAVFSLSIGGVALSALLLH